MPRRDRTQRVLGHVRGVARRVLGPIERFLRLQASSSIVLLFAALAALVWANSRFASSYSALWLVQLPLGWSLGHFIADGLMTLFFLLVGLEIRRELHAGELADLRRATLPLLAAIGGMLVPACLYLIVTLRAPELSRGWGVPMATDIAFAVGVLGLLGERVPPALRVLLLALAIIDDIGAILVIAVFYSSGIQPIGIGIALGGIALVLALQKFGVRNPLAYVVPGAVVWLGALRAGIHPTIAGVVLGLLTPVHARPDEERAPVIALEDKLHGWVAFGIMPLFALANAGVPISSKGSSSTLLWGIGIGLVLGKPLGIAVATGVGVKLGLCRLPTGIGWRGILLVGCVAGIGFTMAIFVAGLAFQTPAHLEAAKLGVLIASLASAVIGLGVGFALPETARAGASTETEAEASAEH